MTALELRLNRHGTYLNRHAKAGTGAQPRIAHHTNYYGNQCLPSTNSTRVKIEAIPNHNHSTTATLTTPTTPTTPAMSTVLLSPLITFRSAPPEAIYSTKDDLFAAIQAHGRVNGYAIRTRSSKPNRILFDCDRSGNYDPKGKGPTHSSRQRKNTGSKKCGCKMRLAGVRENNKMAWTLKVLEDTHNHGPSKAPIAYPAHRIASLTPEVRAEIIRNWQASMSNSTILSSLRIGYPEVSLTRDDLTNITQAKRLKDLGGMTPIQWLLKKLEDRGFSLAFQVNSTNNLTYLFFVHPAALDIYKQYPHVLLLDCTYKTNRFNMPLLNICAITGGNKVLQIALAFMATEVWELYDWVLRQLVEVMTAYKIPQPYFIVTDRELALIKAIDTRFFQSSHILCRWHVNMNVFAKCKRFFPGLTRNSNGVIQRHPQFQAFMRDWICLLNSSSLSEYTSNFTQIRTYPRGAVDYVENT